MALPEEIREEIDIKVRSAFYDREEIIQIFTEEMYEPGELEPAEVEDALDAAVAALEKDRLTWPSVTDCDLLDNAFKALNSQGIIALQNAGYTMSDGITEISEARNLLAQPEKVVGYCFYHEQDMERAVQGAGIDLAFGAIRDAEAENIKIAETVISELKRAGLMPEWNHSVKTRIRIPQFDWKRRRN